MPKDFFKGQTVKVKGLKYKNMLPNNQFPRTAQVVFVYIRPHKPCRDQNHISQKTKLKNVTEKKRGTGREGREKIYISLGIHKKITKVESKKERGKEKTAGQRKKDKQVKEGELKRYGERKRERE